MHEVSAPPKPIPVRIIGKFTTPPVCQDRSAWPFWFVTDARTENSCCQDIYFVNNTDETLEVVESGCGGCQTIDGETVIPVEGASCRYENVLPEEAVKIETYNIIYDSDYLLQLDVLVKSARYGTIAWRNLTKNRVPGGVILHNDGTLGKGTRTL